MFRRHNVSPEHFELEITESTLMADTQRTVRLLGELHEMGLHLSIDDFGTGYSSLSALQQFPIGTLKIDQSFVRDGLRGCRRCDHRPHHHRHGTQLGPRRRGRRHRIAAASGFPARASLSVRQGKLFSEADTIEALLALLARQAAGEAPFGNLIHRTGLASRRA